MRRPSPARPWQSARVAFLFFTMVTTVAGCSLDVAGTADIADSGMSSLPGPPGGSGGGGRGGGSGGAAAGSGGQVAGSAGARAGSGGATGGVSGTTGAGGRAGANSGGAGAGGTDASAGASGAPDAGAPGEDGGTVKPGVDASVPTFAELGELCGQAAAGARPCRPGLFCEQKIGICGGPTTLGTCVPQDAICLAISAPVCGCDGVTHANECARRSKGVQPARAGACTAAAGEPCGGPTGTKCAGNQVCDLPEGQCTVVDAVGTCRKPSTCSGAGRVCGCDGKTYANDCKRLEASQGKSHDGACLVPKGTWGGPGILIQVADPSQGASVTLACGSAEIVGPLALDEGGGFGWSGTATRTTRTSRSMGTAKFGGFLDGAGTLELTIARGNVVDVYSASRGSPATNIDACVEDGPIRP